MTAARPARTRRVAAALGALLAVAALGRLAFVVARRYRLDHPKPMPGWSLPDLHPASERDPRRFFDDVTEASGLVLANPLPPLSDEFADWTAGGGVAIADFDGDGRPDVFVTSTGEASGLFLSRGGMRFENVASAWGAVLPRAWLLGATAADVDGDGDPDLLLAGRGLLALLRNDGGHFTALGADAGFTSTSRNTGVVVADYDRDGFLDAYVTSWFGVRAGARSLGKRGPLPPREPHHLFHNRGDGTFEDVSELLPRESRTSASFGAPWSDFDHDGDPDLYVSNDFGHETVPSQLYRNDGPTPGGGFRFTPVGDECGCRLRISGMSGALADLDRDGFQDLYQTNMLFYVQGGEDGEHLLGNLGGLVFEDVTARTRARAAAFASDRAISWGADSLDVDDDGWVDLYVPFGHFPPDETPDIERQPNALLLNRGGRELVLAAASGAEDAGWSRGVGVADLAQDGCLDRVVANPGSPPRLFQNRCEWGNHWVGLTLVGTRSNRDAVGAVARVRAGGVTWREEVVAGSTSVHSSRWKTRHAGLAAVDDVEVEWPSGLRERFDKVPADRYTTLTEGSGAALATATPAPSPPP